MMTDAERRRQDIQGAYDCAVSVAAHLRAALDGALNSLPPPNRHNAAPDPQPRPDPGITDRATTPPAPHHQDRPGQRPIAIHPGKIADQHAAGLAAASPAGDYQDEVEEIGQRQAQDACGSLAGGEGVAHGVNIGGTLGRRERPILFSAPMIRAILSGAKTQTRRALKTPRGCPKDYVYTPGGLIDPTMAWFQDPQYDRVGWSSKLRYSPSDRLWVRETWRATGCGGRADDYAPSKLQPHSVWYEADGTAPADECVGKLRPSIFMPRWASRITLEVVGVRVERLQSITVSDATAEGCGWRDTGNSADNDLLVGDPVPTYSLLWDHINGAGSWEVNPWVVAVEFRRVGADV